MAEELDAVLALVADGTLTPEQASPIIAALVRAEPADGPRHRDPIDRHLERAERHIERARDRGERNVERARERAEAVRERVAEKLQAAGGRQLRIRVTEHGRQVVNLRIPIGFVDAALNFVPGIGGEQSDRIRAAVRAGTLGPILDVEDPDGDGVLISVE
ncbi:MAG: hypothetical protein M3406_12585 [Chloroflexota bacterium]|nr:hypothetical protein [Chloroflexota bacterium]